MVLNGCGLKRKRMWFETVPETDDVTVATVGRMIVVVFSHYF